MTVPNIFRATTSTQQNTASSAANGLNILGVQSNTAAAPQTVKLVQTEVTEYSTSFFPDDQHQPCPASLIPTNSGEQTLFTCSLLADRHRHSNIREREVPLTQNPIPSGAFEVLRSYYYVDPQGASVPNGHLPGEYRKETKYPRSDGACVSTITTENHVSVTRDCQVSNGYHIHTKKKRVFFPENNNPIPEQAFAFHSHYKYKDDASNAAPSQSQPPSKSASKKRKAPSSDETKIVLKPAADSSASSPFVHKPVMQIVPMASSAAKKAKKHTTKRLVDEHSDNEQPSTSASAQPRRQPQATPKPLQAKHLARSAAMAKFNAAKAILQHRLSAETGKRTADDFSNWAIPSFWNYLTPAEQERYLQHIVHCYQAGATIKQIAIQQKIDIKGVHGLLWLKLDNQRTKKEENSLASKIRVGTIVTPIIPAMPAGMLALGDRIAEISARLDTPEYSQLKAQMRARSRLIYAAKKAKKQAASTSAGISSASTSSALPIFKPSRSQATQAEDSSSSSDES